MAGRRTRIEETKPTAEAARAMVNTGIHVPAPLLERLRMVAVRRATLRGGGRPSVSEVLVDLAERHIDGLESEVGLE